ncbi:hypothetical protein HDU82_000764 [Entophlyctis luteolus]|nr:hypothetical protein HDU82_000764 [Entophlyctis luteolus]
MSMEYATAPPSASQETAHPFGAKYLFLRVATALLRFLADVARQRAPPPEPLPSDIEKSELLVQSREPGRTIRVAVYRKKGTPPRQGPQPVHLNWHGSGYIIPCFGFDQKFCAFLAASAGVVVLDCDYRKAPEHVYPAALNDVLDVVAHVRSLPNEFDATRVTLGGFSAGGSLALCAAAQLGPLRQVAGVAAIYANPDLTSLDAQAPSRTFELGVNVPQWARRFYYACTFVAPWSLADARISAAKADPDAFPAHVFLACGEGDNLHQNNAAFYEKLKAANHPDVVFMSVENAAHSFEKSKVEWPERVQKVFDGVKEMLLKIQEK